MIPEEEILRRKDMRGVLTFTIDPADAKDFDDALSLERIEGEGNSNTQLFEIGVHIADVTHYVRQGDDIDEEAYEKGTSVYLVDRVLPMLPEELCNDLCSLRPQEDKLCMSVIFRIEVKKSESGNHSFEEVAVRKHKVCRSVIRSDYRLTYEQAQDIIDGKDTPEEISDKALSSALLTLNGMAEVLRRKRMEAGAMDLEQDEVRFRLDENNQPVDVFFVEPMPANHLIEEFMLLANRTIAEDIGKKGKTMIYRVHDKPDTEKLDNIEKFRKRMGDTIAPQTLYLLTVRAMAKAVYSTHNIGHYGLAFPYYTHFTSPIRRYPDMMVHRLVAKYLLGDRHEKMPQHLEEAAQHCSDREQAAVQAERDSVKQMQAVWISRHIGEEADGVISSVTNFGLFVTLNDSRCDGLVPLRTLCPGMLLEYEEDNFRIVAYSKRIGRKRGKTKPAMVYTLGDKVRVRIVRADIDKRQIDFRLVE